MPDTPRHDSLDLSLVADPDVRRALKIFHQQMTETIARQQMEIDALVETLLEKHITSMGEFKRIVAKLQQDTSRANRLHGAINPPGPTPGTPPHTPQH